VGGTNNRTNNGAAVETGDEFPLYCTSHARRCAYQPNLCLIERLRIIHGLDLEELVTPAMDDSGIAINAVFASLRQRLLEAGFPFRVDEGCLLAILKFSTFQIWKDLDKNWTRSCVTLWCGIWWSILGRRLSNRFPLTPSFDEGAMRLPIAADESQMAVIVRAASGQSFVLESLGAGASWELAAT